ncbi:sensor histidine kinase [Anaeromyxobacter terrae]|uniref:sensor histidine kinase n=1 Tax=Anaeromyxobacter terrae TaxID=2925406 RepID=UPI001F5857B8|nr:ATP-binding protein [Anaeromyxobacter sp. SG22]
MPFTGSGSRRLRRLREVVEEAARACAPEDAAALRAEVEELVDERALAEAVIDRTAALVVVVDREGRIQRWNAACSRATGYLAGEMLGQPVWELILPEEREGVRATFEQILAGALTTTYENHWVGREGQRRLVSWTNAALLDAAGEVRAVVATGVDITERAEAELALRRQAKRLEALAEASRVFASGLDYKTTLDTVARRLCELIGDGALIRVVSPDGNWLVPVAVYHPSPERAALRRRIIAAAPQRTGEGLTAGPLASGRTLRIPALSRETVRNEMKPEYWPYLEGVTSLLIAPLAQRHEVFGHITLMRDAGGAPYTADDEALLEDLAHRAAQAIENARLYSDAQNAVAARDEFLSIASHELRTPLTALRLALGNMRRVTSREALERLPPEHVERVLVAAERQGQRLEKLVAALLDVSRIHMGKLDLDLEEVELGAVVTDALAQLEDEASQTGSTLSASGTAVRGAWDRLRLSQVVTNLLSNAVKYGAGKPVEVSYGPSATGALLVVRDQGIGIAAADQPQIFERFERAVSSRNYGGLGLGLYIVRRIVEAHGGTIRVESSPGKGSTFQVELPLRPLCVRTGHGPREPAAAH